MSKSSQIAIGVLVTVIIIGTVWYGVTRNRNAAVTAPATTAETAVAKTPAATGSTPPASGTSAASSTANSDATISQDTQNIDSQMNGLNGDNTNAEQSLNQQ